MNQIQNIAITAISIASCLFLISYIFGLLFYSQPAVPDENNITNSGAEVGVAKTMKRLGDTQTILEKKELSKQVKVAKTMKRLGEQRKKELSNLEIKRHVTSYHGILPMRRALEDESDSDATYLARQILMAHINLVDINVGKHASIRDDEYTGITAEFCALNFQAQKDNPPELPMFRDVVGASHCNKEDGHRVRVDLKEVVELVREFDTDNVGGGQEDDAPTILDLKGVVFHESRCGSTLAANSMMALNPEKHRVYSESSPPAMALRICGEDYSMCTVEASANLLKDVIYLMGRSDNPSEENLFFKFQSATTRTMDTFRMAFPTTPWIFLYREPIEVMMSQLDVPSISMANCVRSKNSSPSIKAYIAENEYDLDSLIDEEFCAIHLATLCETAFRNLDDADGLGMAVKYSPGLVNDFLDTIFPIHFHVSVNTAGRDRVLKISGTYSKNRGRHKEGGFKPDSEEKEKKATSKIKKAAEDFLMPSFKQLEGFRGGDDDVYE